MIKHLYTRTGFVAVFVALYLCGCGQTTPKKVSLQNAVATHTVVYQGAASRLNNVQYSELNTFIQSLPVSAVFSATIATENERGYNAKRLHALKAYLITKGIARDSIHFISPIEPDKIDPVYSGTHSQIIMLTLQYTQVIPPEPCPDWSANATADYNNATFSNFGCAYHNNLAVQLQNPADLESGNGKPVISSAHDTPALQAYTSGTAIPTTSAGASSTGTSISGAVGSR